MLTATLTKEHSDDRAAVVFLVSSDASEIRVPAILILPAGSNSVAFEVVMVNGGSIDGTQTVSISASAVGFVSATNWVDVLDDEDSEGGSIGGQVSGVLSEGTFQVLDDVSVPVGETLTIVSVKRTAGRRSSEE